MPARNPVPKIRRHKTKNLAVVDFTDPGTGSRRQVSLGPWGSPDVQPNYERLLADLAAARAEPAAGADLTVAELCVRFLRHAADYYRDTAGKPTSEANSFRLAVRVLSRSATGVAAREFGPRRLQAVRDAMVSLGWSRAYVNSQCRRVRQVFRWGASQELVPAAVWQALASVRGLGRGRTPARETEPVAPARPAQVARTLPHLPPVVAAMARFQWRTGCRPQDVCRLAADAVDRSGPVWVYRPPEHKGAWRGRTREVFVGPRAQAELAPWLLEAGGGPVFPSRGGRAWSKWGYAGAVRRACRRAGVEPWTPLQLRHAAGTRFRERFGLEMARVLLGHDKTSTTEIYAEKPRQRAADAMRRVG